MPNIRPSSDLRNSYNEISEFCHESSEPVFITKNGRGDLAVMSIESYEELKGRFELYARLAKGLEESRSGEGSPLAETLENIRNSRKSEV